MKGARTAITNNWATKTKVKAQRNNKIQAIKGNKIFLIDYLTEELKFKKKGILKLDSQMF